MSMTKKVIEVKAGDGTILYWSNRAGDLFNPHIKEGNFFKDIDENELPDELRIALGLLSNGWGNCSAYLAEVEGNYGILISEEILEPEITDEGFIEWVEDLSGGKTKLTVEEYIENMKNTLNDFVEMYDSNVSNTEVWAYGIDLCGEGYETGIFLPYTASKKDVAHVDLMFESLWYKALGIEERYIKQLVNLVNVPQYMNVPSPINNIPASASDGKYKDISKERIVEILKAYVSNDAESAEPDYIRDTLLSICTDDELKTLGLYDEYCFELAEA
jgi:hypothetical protein